MKPAPFKYIAAATIEEALTAKADYGDDARFLAGGQSLIPTLNFRLAQPAVLIDLNRIGGLGAIDADGDRVRIGAMTRYRDLERDPAIAASAPLMTEALPHIAHPQIRNRGTLGGNLSHADPASEMPAIVLALKGRLRARSTTRERWIAAADFFRGPLTTALAPDEMLIEIEIPKPEPRTGTAFIEVARRRGDFAMMGVAATVTRDAGGVCTGVRIGLCGAGETPVDASDAASIMIGTTAPPLDAIAERVRLIVNPTGSIHANAGYQRHLAGVVVKRALRIAMERAHG